MPSCPGRRSARVEVLRTDGSRLSHHAPTRKGDPDAPLPTARETHVVAAPASGVLTRLDAMAVGLAAWRLGAGRARKEDPVQAGAGVEWHARPGDEVVAGEPLLTLHTDEADRFERALASLDGGFDIAADGSSYQPEPLVIDRIS